MRVGFDGRILETPGGVGRYAGCLVSAMRRVAPEVEWVVCAPAGGRLFHEQVGIPRLARRRRFDLYHGPKNQLPYRRLATPAVVTIHDMLPLTQPATERFLARPYWRLALRGAVRNAAQVIAVSRYSRDAFLAETGFPPERVTVVPHGCPRLGKPPASPEELDRRLARWGVARPYLLSVATVQPRKNHGALLAAFERLRREGYPGSLVVVGRRGWRCGGLGRAEAGREKVVWPGFVPDGDLPALYAGADLFLYPSLAEGFGLPPLEAASYGTPVVASRAGGLLEVLGEGALWVDPLSPAEIARAAGDLLARPALRQALSARGRALSARRTWEEAAAETLAVYRRAVA